MRYVTPKCLKSAHHACRRCLREVATPTLKPTDTISEVAARVKRTAMRMTVSHPVVPAGRLIIFVRDVREGEHEAGQPRQAQERRLEAHPGRRRWH